MQQLVLFAVNSQK